MVVLFEKLLIPLQVTFSCFICVTSTLTPPTSPLIPPPRQVSVISMVEFVSEERGAGVWGGGVLLGTNHVYLYSYFRKGCRKICALDNPER